MTGADLHTFDGWRARAKNFLLERISPSDARWDAESSPVGETGALFSFDRPSAAQDAYSPKEAFLVPKEFVTLAKKVCLHRDDAALALLYRLLWRITRGERTLLGNPIDQDVLAAKRLARSVSKDIHKMHAFVRFRRTESPEGEIFVAFHRSDHFILRLASSFFVKRFATMRWRIETPDETAHWDTHVLRFSSGVQCASVTGDPLETDWKTYYKAIANPARLKLRMMKKEMPVRYWQTMPETEVISSLLREAGSRVEKMQENSTLTALPRSQSLPELREEVACCTACPLHRAATQAVFGSGNDRASLVLIGEQPGNEEDLRGLPFVGPAGKLLDRALSDAGIERSELYLTNAVKHFKFEERGKVRLHKKADGREIVTCKPWLLAELSSIRPQVVVCLGATAAQSLLGRAVTIKEETHSTFVTEQGARLLVTYHPAAILRASGSVQEELYSVLVDSLRRARREILRTPGENEAPSSAVACS